MILFERARESHVEQGAKSAVVCSRPPAEVGTGIGVLGVREVVGWERGRKKRYI